MARIRLYPAYTTVAAVKAELPPRFSDEDLPDISIQEKIDGQANLLDGLLTRYYQMPAEALPDPLDDGTEHDSAGNPLLYVPTQLEYLNRYMAVRECLILLRDLRGNEKGNSDPYKDEYTAVLLQITQGSVVCIYPFRHEDGRPYFLPLAAGSPLYGSHPLSARSRVKGVYPARTFTPESMAGWGPG